MKNITVVITNFERYDRLKVLLDSIDKYYPNMPIIVVEYSKEPITINRVNVTTMILPFDSGLSMARNRAIEQVETKYFLLLDNDFEFNENTKIEVFEDILENSDLDLIGADVINPFGRMLPFNGLLELDNDRVLHYNNACHIRYDDYEVCDVVLNFFLAKTEVIRRCLWNEKLKVAEHVDFFWRYKGKIRVGYTDKVSIKHNPGGYDEKTLKLRMRNNDFFERWLTENNIKGIVNFNGKYLQNPYWTEK